VNTFREAFFDMTKFVNVETVTTKSGARTYQQKATVTGFQLVVESGAIPALAQPQFLRRTYTIKDYAGFIPVSRQLLSDTDANLVRVIMRWFGRNSAATRNNLIFNLIKTKTQTTIANMNDLRTALNVTLGSVYKPTSKIFVNDDALNYIDGLVDGDGRPFLNPDPTAPAQMRFRVGANVIPIVNVPNAFLPTVSNVAPIIIGDLEEGITLFDREHLTIDRSEVASVGSYNAFEQGGTLFRGIEREDVVQVDGDAFVYGGIDLTQATANGSGYSPFLGASSEEEGGEGGNG
jgi:HK97 family phage major capsid protein